MQKTKKINLSSTRWRYSDGEVRVRSKWLHCLALCMGASFIGKDGFFYGWKYDPDRKFLIDLRRRDAEDTSPE